jgi:hypothetical protein
MHCNIDATIQQRLFNLARKQTLAADILQRPILNLVAHHLDDHNRKGRLRQVMRQHQTAPHLMRLP